MALPLEGAKVGSRIVAQLRNCQSTQVVKSAVITHVILPRWCRYGLAVGLRAAEPAGNS